MASRRPRDKDTERERERDSCSVDLHLICSANKDRNTIWGWRLTFWYFPGIYSKICFLFPEKGYLRDPCMCVCACACVRVCASSLWSGHKMLNTERQETVLLMVIHPGLACANMTTSEEKLSHRFSSYLLHTPKVFKVLTSYQSRNWGTWVERFFHWYTLPWV